MRSLIKRIDRAGVRQFLSLAVFVLLLAGAVGAVDSDWLRGLIVSGGALIGALYLWDGVLWWRRRHEAEPGA